ncbi:dihydropteroate synthase [Chloroflexi bacterium TSY]|nr:dihydropteroate synthase [Chloroflexi bacterium TSY]
MLTLEYLHDLYEKHRDAFHAQVEEFSLGGRHFRFNSEVAILGVINLSTDSWNKDSICYSSEQAIRRGILLKAQGVDLVDLGAESTQGEAARVDAMEQNRQILPVLKTLSQEGVLTSVETYYEQVARECLMAGTNVVNLSGSEENEKIYRTVAEFDAGVIICYVQAKNPREIDTYQFADTGDPVDLIYESLAREIEIATNVGVRKIFVDPGAGFTYPNLDYQANRVALHTHYKLKTFLTSFRLRTLGFPVCNQMSSFVESFVEEYRSGQLLSALFAMVGRTDLIRTHHVAQVKGAATALEWFQTGEELL